MRFVLTVEHQHTYIQRAAKPVAPVAIRRVEVNVTKVKAAVERTSVAMGAATVVSFIEAEFPKLNVIERIAIAKSAGVILEQALGAEALQALMYKALQGE